MLDFYVILIRNLLNLSKKATSEIRFSKGGFIEDKNYILNTYKYEGSEAIVLILYNEEFQFYRRYENYNIYNDWDTIKIFNFNILQRKEKLLRLSEYEKG